MRMYQCALECALVCVCVCVRACVRACMRACVRATVQVWDIQAIPLREWLYQKGGTALSVLQLLCLSPPCRHPSCVQRVLALGLCLCLALGLWHLTGSKIDRLSH